MVDMQRKRLRGVWFAMIARCENRSHPSFATYGGRGITVCDRWHDLDAFLADMGPRPDGHSIERLDNDAGYSPKNCVWATPKQQAQNRRLRGRIACDGQLVTYTEAARKTGLNEATIRMRVKAGWDSSAILSIPALKMARIVTRDGLSLKAACKRSGISYTAALKRVAAGWSVEDSLSKPMRQQRRAA